MPMTPTATSRVDARRRLALAVAGIGIPLDGMVVAAAAIVWAALGEKRLWARTPLDLPLAAFLAWSILAAAVSEFRSQALLEVFGLACAIYVAYQLPFRWFQARPDLTGALYRWACIGLPIAAAVGLMSYLYLDNPHLGSFRRFSLGPQPPGVSAYALLAAMLLSLGAFPHRRWIAHACLAAGVFALIGTLSRWAILGFCIGLTFWSTRVVREQPRAVVSVLATVVISAAITLSLPLSRTMVGQYLPGDQSRNPWHRALVVGFTPSVGFAERLAIWRTTKRIIESHPWFGIGHGAFGAVYVRYRDPADRTIAVMEMPTLLGAAHAHNDVLAVAAAAGLPAAIAFVLLLVLALVRAFSQTSLASAPAAAALVAVLVHGIFDAVSQAFAGPLLMFWIVLAASMAGHQPDIIARRASAMR